MVPVHDTDLAEERWSKAEWEHFELWEKIELQLRRRRLKWNMAVAVVFLVISAVPPVADGWARWEAQWLSGRLAQEIGAVKREAALQHQPYRLRFDPKGRLTYTVERASSCEDAAGTMVRTGSLISEKKLEHYRLVDPAQGAAQGVPGLVDVFCYDPARGVVVAGAESGQLMGMAIAPVSDLARGRADRMAVLLISGSTGAIGFD